MKIGQKRLAADAAAIRAQQSKPLTEIERELQMDEESIADARKWQATAKQFSQQMPMTVEVSLGKVGDTDLGNFAYKLTDEERRELDLTLQDPAYLAKSIVDTKTGKTDPSKLFNLLVWQKIGQSAVRAAAVANYSAGADSILATLENRPDLSRTGDRNTEDVTAIEEGKKQLVKDASSILGGRQPRAKSL